MANEWEAKEEPVYVGVSLEPDVCGKLPSGEHCSRKPDHDGHHMKLEMRLIRTKYQEPCDGESPHTGPWKKLEGSDQASQCACEHISGK